MDGCAATVERNGDVGGGPDVAGAAGGKTVREDGSEKDDPGQERSAVAGHGKGVKLCSASS